MNALTTSLCLIALSACAVDDAPALAESASALDASDVGHELARASLLAADQLLAASIVAFGEADGVWPWLADDASYLHPDVPVLTGRAAIRDFLRATYPDRNAQHQQLHRETGDASGDASLGYTFGWFDEDMTTSDGGQATRFGKYLATWKRAHGPWQLVGLVRVPGSGAPSVPPADATIFTGDHGVPHPSTAAATRAQAFAADRAFAQLSADQGYTIAFTSYGASDAVVVAGSDFFWNAAGVAFAWGGWTPAETLAWEPTLGAGAASGDLAFTIGTATYSLATGTGTQTSHSKYLTVWTRQADGSWRFLLDGGNASPAPLALR